MSIDITQEEAIRQAKVLQKYLSKKYGEISIGACMQAVALMNGHKAWYYLVNEPKEVENE